MPGVMDLDYILCDSVYPKLDCVVKPISPVYSCQSSVCSSPETNSFSVSPPTFHRRVHSEPSNFVYTQTRTPWTPQEDSLLHFGYEQGLSWAMISTTYLPHRSRGCCWGRYKTLQNKQIVEKQKSKRPWKVTTHN
ncbi:hypothetical protein BY458DRAFT_582408 [Sporodiniella umbellata]|nr:hypothetical protein BY458DRAFT_582408 [Sporodiniella umbellata]